MEEKIKKREMQGSVIKVISVSEEGEAKVNATYMPNVAAIRPFNHEVSHDKPDAEQLILNPRESEDDDQTSVIDCHENDNDEMGEVDVCMIEAEEEGEESDDESIPSLEEVTLTGAEAAEEGKNDMNELFTSVAQLNLDSKGKQTVKNGTTLEGADLNAPKVDWKEEFPGGVRPKTRQVQDSKAERLEQELRAARARIGKQRIDILRLEDEIRRRRGSAFGPGWKLEEEEELGIEKPDLEKNMTLKAELASEMGMLALVKTNYRKKDETFLQAAKRLGPEGVYEKRMKLIWKMAKDWNEAKERKSVETIKEEVKIEAENKRKYYEKRAERVKKHCEDKYLPPDWRHQSDGEEEEEEQYQAEKRVELARDGLFGDMVSFDPVMG